MFKAHLGFLTGRVSSGPFTDLHCGTTAKEKYEEYIQHK